MPVNSDLAGPSPNQVNAAPAKEKTIPASDIRCRNCQPPSPAIDRSTTLRNPPEFTFSTANPDPAECYENHMIWLVFL